jgi:hypothetical protein
MEVNGLIRDMIELDAIDVRYAKDEGKDFFHTEEIVDWIGDYFKKFFIVKGILDQYMGLAYLPVFHDKGLKQIELMSMSRDLSSRIYQNLMSKMLDGSLRIPEGNACLVDGKMTNDLPLVTELLQLRATLHSKYLITVESSEVKGMHDDLSDAYARSVYLASDFLSKMGGISRNNIIESTSGSGSSYRQYAMKQRRNVLYTNRPSSSIQMEAMRAKQLGSAMDRLGTPLTRRTWGR